MSKTAGSIWVDGNTFHYIDSSGVEWYATGSAGSIVSGTPGSLWVEGTSLKYLDSSSRVRTLPSSLIASRAGSRLGSLWVSNTSGTSASTGNTQFRFIANNASSNTEYAIHDDVAHQDHSDYSHTDVVHTDYCYDSNTATAIYNVGAGTHCDYCASGQWHSDSCLTGHSDACGTGYSDGCGFDDGYGCTFTDSCAFVDTCTNYGDCASQHSDHGDVTHTDHTDGTTTNVAHSDDPVYVGP